ncbi:MAG: alkaline phosphatase family protein [Mycobacteriaceae bacterium]
MGEMPLLPMYGRRSLADVVPSLMSALGVQGFANPLEVPELRGICLLLVDGLGWELLQEHAADAPFLASLAVGGRPLTAGFPATTATSIASLGTGLPPGQHGIVGYAFAPPHGDCLLNALTWREHGVANPGDLSDRFVPETVQPLRTALERATDAGVEVTVAAPAIQRSSGLTRAVLRGGHFRSTYALGDLAATALSALGTGQRAFCYAYHGDLDLMGHARGPGSLAWRLQLRHVDSLAASIAEGLAPGCALAVVADHGMVELGDRVDADQEPDLQTGVRLLGGEVRVRHVYTLPGAQAAVLAAWREVLGDRAWVLTRTEAVTAGWFGPEVSERVLPRIGDLVVAARGTTGIVRSAVEPLESRLIGHHGSLTAAEQYVPFLLSTREGGYPLGL